MDSSLELSELGSRGAIEALAAALPDSLKWEWDDRFGCVAAAFEVAEKETMHSAVKAQLSLQWNRDSIRSAPTNVKKAINDFGGVATGQLLFARGLTEEIILLGLWWPWGHGATISIRFVPYGKDASDEAVDAVRAELKKAFRL